MNAGSGSPRDLEVKEEFRAGVGSRLQQHNCAVFQAVLEVDGWGDGFQA